mmetsp:Transcript_22682/g.52604  ORF Transcript_22682/g.52604 Transcript_22682/m.52604 type:complete len:533 (+) Transcript_22682:990-2588(+)
MCERCARATAESSGVLGGGLSHAIGSASSAPKLASTVGEAPAAGGGSHSGETPETGACARGGGSQHGVRSALAAARTGATKAAGAASGSSMRRPVGMACNCRLTTGARAVSQRDAPPSPLALKNASSGKARSAASTSDASETSAAAALPWMARAYEIAAASSASAVRARFPPGEPSKPDTVPAAAAPTGGRRRARSALSKVSACALLASARTVPPRARARVGGAPTTRGSGHASSGAKHSESVPSSREEARASACSASTALLHASTTLSAPCPRPSPPLLPSRLLPRPPRAPPSRGISPPHSSTSATRMRSSAKSARGATRGAAGLRVRAASQERPEESWDTSSDSPSMRPSSLSARSTRTFTSPTRPSPASALSMEARSMFAATSAAAPRALTPSGVLCSRWGATVLASASTSTLVRAFGGSCDRVATRDARARSSGAPTTTSTECAPCNATAYEPPPPPPAARAATCSTQMRTGCASSSPSLSPSATPTRPSTLPRQSTPDKPPATALCKSGAGTSGSQRSLADTHSDSA